MSGDTDKAKISDNQDEDKKSGTGDGQTTEDESSQDSKGESAPMDAQGNNVADNIEGDAKSTTANGKEDDCQGEDSKDDRAVKTEHAKKVMYKNGETHDDDDKEDLKENDKGAKKLAPKKKPKKEDTEEEEEDEEEEDEEEEDEEGEEGDEEEEQKTKEKVKKPVKKPKDGEEEGDDEEEGEEEGEEEEEEEEEEEAPKPKPKKEPTEPPVPLPAGKGIPLGHISNVEVSLSRFKTQDQKILHQYLYGQLCLDRNVKRNIKKFKGYEWAIGSTEYKAKLEETAKMEPKQLRTMCEMLDLDKKGGASELAARLVGFLQQPVANSPHARGVARPPTTQAATPGGRPRRSAAVKIHNRDINITSTVAAAMPPSRAPCVVYPEHTLPTAEATPPAVSHVPLGPQCSLKSVRRRRCHHPHPYHGAKHVVVTMSCSYSDEEYESDPETKVKGPKQPKDGSEDSDGSFNPSGSEADSDFDPEGGEGVSGAARKRKSSGRRRSSKGKRGRKSKGRKKGGSRGRGRRARSDSEDESERSDSDSELDSASDGDESDEPKSKRGRPAGSVSKGRKGAVAKASAKATPAKRKAPTPTGKKKAGAKPVGRPAKKGKRASSDESGDGEEGSEEEDEEGSEEEESGEEDDEPTDKKAKRPPTDEEIKKYVKQILEGANLEQITMKTVCKQVYSHYPDFDLAHKKDFIKATVKSRLMFKLSSYRRERVVGRNPSTKHSTKSEDPA
ncbi:hypothetical protein KGM_204526 [Danaus plexippus plexippus]|uniref:Protein DEK n=1 Tax=Danaus plexippus plexippus TaxID=278856 RepID=A0A212ESN1_DANPL|nr:hypothetical protein KGM_204526 [Danaus plexippus plexippus]